MSTQNNRHTYHFNVRLSREELIHECFLGNNWQDADDEHDRDEKPGKSGSPLALHEPVDVSAVGRESPHGRGVDEREDEKA